MDQAQEQNNNKIKASGSGYIDLVNVKDKRFLSSNFVGLRFTIVLKNSKVNLTARAIKR